MQLKQPKPFLIIDSSTIIGLERAGLLDKLKKLDFPILLPRGVFEELGLEALKTWGNITIEHLRGKSMNKKSELIKAGIGNGEAECLVLAAKMKLGFIVSDDRKLIRQKYFFPVGILQKINILGFSFMLHLFEKSGLIKDIWASFDEVINKNNWKRSEVEIANYSFLKSMGY